MGRLATQEFQHHGAAPNLTDGVCNVLSCDVWCRTMNRFKQRGKFAVWIEVGTGCNANRACASWTQVAQNVTKQITGHDHIEKVGALHKVRRQNIDVKFVNMDTRIVLGHFDNSLIPIRHGDGNAVGFGGTGEMLLRASLR